MFCPKCGTENPDNTRFCRVCGANLSNVLAAVDGERISESDYSTNKEISELYSTGVRNVILGAGFFVASIILKSIPGDTAFWFLMMIPAFCLIASGIGRILKSDGLKKLNRTNVVINQISTEEKNSLPPTQTEYVSPNVSYKTNDLVVSSVTEGTTHQLQINKDGETMTLPKK